MLQILLGYAAYWAINTPDGRAMIKKTGGYLLEQCGVLEKEVLNVLKGEKEKEENHAL